MPLDGGPPPVEHTYDPRTPSGQVRLILNDVGEPFVFSDAEVEAFLALERDSVKRAAAQAIDSQATNEALASKVLRTAAGTTTDGAKLADAMRKHATALRAQAADQDDADDGGFFEVVDVVGSPGDCYAWGPELTDRWSQGF